MGAAYADNNKEAHWLHSSLPVIANRWEDEKCSVKAGTAPPGVFRGTSRDRYGRAGEPQARVHACCQARSGCDSDTQQYTG